MTVVAEQADTSEPEEAEEADVDLEPMLSGRTVDLGRALLAGFVAVFFAGAVVFAWQQWANAPRPNDVDVGFAMAWMGMAPVPQTEQPGMASEAELAELDAAEGEELDDLFSALMIAHHRGGQHMAQNAVDHGSEDVVTHLAQAIVTTQQSEVAEMNLRREALGLSPV